MALLGLYLAACMVLVGAGAAKVWRPGDTARALAGAVPIAPRVLRRVVRIGAVGEIAVGVLAFVVPDAMSAGALAASYAAFAVFVAYARGHGGVLATCGCFGKPDVPPTLLHIVIDVALAVAGAALALDPAGRSTLVTTILVRQPAHGIPLVLVSSLCAWLVVITLSTLPRTMAELLPAADRHR